MALDDKKYWDIVLDHPAGELMYNYTWGSEDGAWTERVWKLYNDHYRIEIDQDVFGDYFYDVVIGGTILATKTTGPVSDDYVSHMVTVYVVKERCNPPPHELYELRWPEQVKGAP